MRFLTVTVTLALFTALAPAQAAPQLLGDPVPLFFDVWVNGVHSTRTTVAGVPTSGQIGDAWVSFVPTSDSATLFVDVEVVALRAGTHTIGIGLEGRNGGVIISGGIGSVFQGRFTWTGALAGLISPVP